MVSYCWSFFKKYQFTISCIFDIDILFCWDLKNFSIVFDFCHTLANVGKVLVDGNGRQAKVNDLTNMIDARWIKLC